MLVFLYLHQTSLVSAEHIARLLGYATGEVAAALEHLESLGFVERSRVSQGARLYQFTARAHTPPGAACHRLIASQTAARCGCSWPGGGGEATEYPIIIVILVCSVEKEGKHGGKRA